MCNCLVTGCKLVLFLHLLQIPFLWRCSSFLQGSFLCETVVCLALVVIAMPSLDKTFDVTWGVIKVSQVGKKLRILSLHNSSSLEWKLQSRQFDALSSLVGNKGQYFHCQFSHMCSSPNENAHMSAARTYVLLASLWTSWKHPTLDKRFAYYIIKVSWNQKCRRLLHHNILDVT